MRILNTSFIKNAIRFFAFEATDVLRAYINANPAANLWRQMQSFVRTLIESVERHSQFQLVQPAFKTIGEPGMPGAIGRKLSVLPIGNLDYPCGKSRPDCYSSLSSS